MCTWYKCFSRNPHIYFFKGYPDANPSSKHHANKYGKEKRRKVVSSKPEYPIQRFCSSLNQVTSKHIIGPILPVSSFDRFMVHNAWLMNHPLSIFPNPKPSLVASWSTAKLPSIFIFRGSYQFNLSSTATMPN